MSTNVAASVRARLLNLARATDRPFQELLQYYGLERFLYRLSKSEYRDRFVLKGAFLIRGWNAIESRPTRDIDLLAYVDNEIGSLESIAKKLCDDPVEPDGLVFDPSSVAGLRIKEGADYEGVRLKLLGYLERARISIQLDIAFGDVVYPNPTMLNYSTMLNMPEPRLRAYSRESVIAEKFQTVVQLGTINSRMKDFFDLWILSRSFDFDGPTLAEAILRTFDQRDTEFVAEPVALTREFTGAPTSQKQWASFASRSRLEGVPKTLEGVQEALRDFLLPIVGALMNKREFNQTWIAPGPWRTKP